MATAHRKRPFAAYLATQASWFFAFGLQSVLVPFSAKRLLEASDAQFGIVQASLMAPIGAIILFGGIIAERTDRRALLIRLHLFAFLPPIVLALAAATNVWTLNGMVAYGLVMGAIGAIMMPTRDAALNAAADASTGAITVQRAVVLTSMVQFVSQIAGMAAASLASQAVSMTASPESIGDATRWLTALLIFVQGVVLAAGVAAAWALPPLPVRQRAEGEHVFRQMAEGLAIVWRSPPIRTMVIAMIGVGVFVIGMSFFVLLPLLILETFGGGLNMLGLALIVFWLGAASATAALARFHVERPGLPLVCGFGFGGLSLGLMSFDVPFFVVVFLVFFWGVSGGLGIAMSRAIVQEAAPPQARARVLSVYQLGFVAGAPVGMVAMGFIVQHFDNRVGAWIAMAGVLAMTLWLLAFSPVMKVRAHQPN